MVTQDTWQYQGRQEHGWFGDGTAPDSGKKQPPDKPSPAALAQRIHDVGHTLVAGLPASKRYHPAAKLGLDDHARLDRLLSATLQALPAGGPAIARHVFGVAPDTPGIDGFVRAARLLRDASGSPDIRAATDAIGRAAQDIGLDRFKPFLQTADDHLQAKGGLLKLARFPPSPSTQTLAGRLPGLLARPPWGAVIGLAAQVLPMVAQLIQREDVRDTIKRFSLDPSKPADVTAAYAFLWAEDHGPWLFDTPQTGPEMQAMAERVMRAARSDPALFGRAIAGDEDAQQEFSAAVAPSAPGSDVVTHNDEERALVAQRLGEGRTVAEIQAELNGMRATGTAKTSIYFRTSHYAARLAKDGVDIKLAEKEVETRLAQIASSVPAGAIQIDRLTLNKVLLEYRYFKRPDGSINVGTIFPVK